MFRRRNGLFVCPYHGDGIRVVSDSTVNGSRIPFSVHPVTISEESFREIVSFVQSVDWKSVDKSFD